MLHSGLLSVGWDSWRCDYAFTISKCYIYIYLRIHFGKGSPLLVDIILLRRRRLLSRDGKVRFGPVLQGILKNPEPDYQFGPLITVNTADRGQYKIIAYVLAMLCHI